jgi:ABC-type transporter Mla subunit MlaD
MTDPEAARTPVPMSPEVAAHAAKQAAPAPKNSAEIHADIAAAREQLGRTVEELAQRLDVAARTKEQLAKARERARDQGRALAEQSRRNPAIVAGAASATFLLLAWLVVRRVRRS